MPGRARGNARGKKAGFAPSAVAVLGVRSYVRGADTSRNPDR